jgi:hydrogenase expression/formation protein HypE
MSPEFTLACPIPSNSTGRVQIGHGGGGRLTRDLIQSVFAPAFGSQAETDSALFSAPSAGLALTTDSFVVQPLFFPGGDIGSLAVHGTVNDLAMAGARPLAMAAAFVLEEGLPMETLRRVADSMAAAARACGVPIITGDTKVIERTRGDQLFITTTGVGQLLATPPLTPAGVRKGDVILLSGDIARHGIAIMASREGLEFESAIESDSAPVHEPVLAMLEAGVELHCLRDCTRGGVATALIEIAGAARVDCEVDESEVLIRGDVRAACELMGFDPLYVANESRFIAFLPEEHAARALDVLRGFDVAAKAAVIGRAGEAGRGRLTARGPLGALRVLDLLSGEQLPRIC